MEVMRVEKNKNYRVKLFAKDGRPRLYTLQADSAEQAFRIIMAIQKDLGIEIDRVEEVVKI